MTYSDNQPVVSKIIEVYSDLIKHDGPSKMSVEIKLLKKDQKEVIIHCGKKYRLIEDYCQRKLGGEVDSVNKD